MDAAYPLIPSTKVPRPIYAGSWRFFLPGIALLGLVIMFGCGSGIHVRGDAPSIIIQPQNTSTPLGGSATFQVEAEGSPTLKYQWMRDGVALPFATANSYQVSNAPLSESGHFFSVTVTNDLGQVTSAIAQLKIGPRSPGVGDLRFQQVGAATTVNGYTAEFAFENLLPLQVATFPSGTGIPLSVGPGCETGAAMNLLDCGWLVYVNELPANVTGYGVNYGSYHYSQGASVLTQIEAPNVVITGWDIAPDFDSLAISWAQATNVGVFDVAQRTVPPASLPLAANEDGAQGRVITAISFNAGFINFLSYGWTQNQGLSYDTSIAYCTKTEAAAAATQMAQDGFILTAIGGNDQSGLILVGTKVKGDTLPRPFIVIPGGQSAKPLADQGYAMVAVIYSGTSGFISWLGEK